MSRIDDIFSSLADAGRGGLMPFITAGYPSLDATEPTLLALNEAGADIVEIGVPFSDPIADGPVIASAMHEALQQGVTPDDVFEVVGRVRNDVDMGIVLMVSDSIVERIGAASFIQRAREVGADGLIVPDIDTAAAGEIAALTRQHDMSFTLLVAPNSTETRMAEIVKHCSGFVYLLARVGLTGEQDAAPQIQQQVQRLRQMTDLPIAVGFGISRAEHVRAVVAHADAAIVGSALVRRMGDAGPEHAAAQAAALVRELASGLERVSQAR